MRVRLSFAASVALILFAGCQQSPQSAPATASSIKDWSTLIITLDRGPCYGRCPIYTVQIHGDGSVVYEGVNFVGTAGRQTATIPVETVRALVAKFEAANFSGLKDEYRAQITDGPTYTVILAHDGDSKLVTDYVGGMVGMPKAISEIEEAIDIAAGTAKWVDGYVPKSPSQ